MSARKENLWGGEFWTDSYFASTVGKHGDEAMIGRYVKNQGKEYNKVTQISVGAFLRYPAACGGVVHFAERARAGAPRLSKRLKISRRYVAESLSRQGLRAKAARKFKATGVVSPQDATRRDNAH